MVGQVGGLGYGGILGAQSFCRAKVNRQNGRTTTPMSGHAIIVG